MPRKKMLPSKKELLRAIRKETRPPAGFGQWVIIFEAKKLTEDLGLVRLEGYSDKRLEWSGSLSIPLPQAKTFGPDGKELTPSPNWDTIAVGASRFSVLTMEMPVPSPGRIEPCLRQSRGSFRLQAHQARGVTRTCLQIASCSWAGLGRPLWHSKIYAGHGASKASP